MSTLAITKLSNNSILSSYNGSGLKYRKTHSISNSPYFTNPKTNSQLFFGLKSYSPPPRMGGCIHHRLSPNRLLQKDNQIIELPGSKIRCILADYLFFRVTAFLAGAFFAAFLAGAFFTAFLAGAFFFVAGLLADFFFAAICP